MEIARLLHFTSTHRFMLWALLGRAVENAFLDVVVAANY